MILNSKYLFVSPGVSLAEPLIAQALTQGAEVVNDIALFSQSITTPLAAITGSNGKSTVSTLVTEMARQAGREADVVGNIGVPVLDVLRQQRQCDLYVMEVSSFQLEKLATLKSDVAALLNISEDHMDYHRDMEEYLMIKRRIYQGCRVAVFNRQDRRLYPDQSIEQRVSFGLDQPAEGEWGVRLQNGVAAIAYGAHCLLPLHQISWTGASRVINALAALAIGQALGLNQEAMVQTIQTFPGLPHRCQRVCELDGIYWYNDSKGTNVGATIAAIESLSQRHNGKIVLIAGGVSKGADFSPLRRLVKQHVRKLIVMGESARQLKRVLQDSVNVEEVATLDDAVASANLVALRDDVVLLSPACASFDRYDNYQQRGEHFIDLVKAI